MKTLIMVIGDHGSGKTSVVKYLAEEHGFEAVHNEQLYIKYQEMFPDSVIIDDESLIDRIYEDAEKEIRDKIRFSGVAYEATGAKPQWSELRSRLADLKPVVLMVKCPFTLAMKRRSVQDITGKYKSPKNHSIELHRILVKANMRHDFSVDNSLSFEKTKNQLDKLVRDIGVEK